MDKHAVASLLLLASLAALIRAPTYVTAASLSGGRLHPLASSFCEDAGDYFSNAEESAEEERQQPAAVFKRAPWAPTEIRYDAFVQKLLAGKNKLSGNRDKHSTGAGRTEQAFQRLGRSSLTHDSDVDSHDYDSNNQLNEISKIVKDLARQVDEIQAAVGRMKSSNVKHQTSDEERSDVEIGAPSGVEKSAASEIASQRDQQLKAKTAAAMESTDLEDLLRDASEILNELNASRVRHRRATKEFSSRARPAPGRSESVVETEAELSPRGLIKASAAVRESRDASNDLSKENLQPGSRKDAVAEWLLRGKQAAGEKTVRFPLRVESSKEARATSDVGRLGSTGGRVDDGSQGAAGLQRQGVFVQDKGAPQRDSAKSANDSGRD